MAKSTPKPPSAKKSGGRTTPKKKTEVTSASAWKGKVTKKPHPLELPSGNTCLVKRVGMESFLQTGMMPNSLMGMVQGALDKAKSGGQVKPDDEAAMMSEITNDPAKMADMFALMDAVVIDCVVEPKVSPIPDDDEERDEDTLYIDEVDLNDRMFIFNYVSGGSADLERFRDETAERLALGEAGD